MAKTKVRPLGDKILLKRAEAAAKTASGIYLPEKATEKPQRATVVSVGTGRKLKGGKRADFQVKKGDTVLLSKWGGTDIKVDGEELLMVSEDDVLAIID
jgi:chaperonin GroES